MANIARLKDAEISNGNVIDADDLDSEFNQIISAYNANDTILTGVATGTYTLSGVKTFSSTPKMNAIDERTAASGVTIDSVRCKDGMVKVAGTPTENGEIGYDSNTLKAYINGGVVNLGGLTCTIRVYTSSGTWTKPSGLVYAVITVIGGGGGGGGVVDDGTDMVAGAGGGGGGMAREVLLAASLGATESYTVGAGGTAGANTGGTGGTGGTSNFGTSPFLQATGGAGGTGMNAGGGSSVSKMVKGGAGGTGSSGDINATGGAGGPGQAVASATSWAMSGQGGDSLYGGGAASVSMTPSDTTDKAGNTGVSYGGGGSGAVDDDTSGSAGGAGAAGVVIVEEYTNA